MQEQRIRLMRKDKVALVIMDRPEKKNAFDSMMFEALSSITRQLARDLPRAVVLTGVGGAFSAGYDVSLENPMTQEFFASVEARDEVLARKVVQGMRQAVDRFADLPVPLIAAVNGLAYGGGAELATRCDLRVMDRGAAICFSEVKLGLMPDWGGGPCLTRLVGPGRAADLILTGRKVLAEEAAAMGWATQISEAGASVAEALKVAGQISQNGPRAVASALAVIRQSPGLTLEAALEKETDLAARLIASGECLHGITAFMERKVPRFPG